MKAAAIVITVLLVTNAFFSGFAIAQGEPAEGVANVSEPANDGVTKDGTLLLKKGTAVLLEFAQSLSSQTNRTGEEVHYRVVNDLKVGDAVVIAAGADAFGKIISAKAAKGWGKSGKLEVSVEKVKAADGSEVKLAATFEDSKSWSGAKTILGVAALGALFGGGMKGKKVNINEGHQIEVFIAEDATLNPNAGGAGEESGDARACLKLCADQMGDEFKACMSSCGECKNVCGELKGDDLFVCLTNCLEK